jgi:hypothetical protein
MIIKGLKINKLLPLIAVLALSFTAISILAPHKTQAVSAAEWKPGHIIDDAVFFNKDTMSVGQIQDFLNAKVPACDRWNPTTFSYAGKPYGPPYTCLKEYQENPTTHENNIGRFNANGTPYNVPGGWSAAQIIWDAAQAYNINPQSLIVLLQKETAIVTDPWSAGWQYDRAMGYGCPDSGPNGTANCNASYYGFYNQVGNAAWQLRRYVTYPDQYNFKAGVTRNILWQVGGVCGSAPVYLENSATAALYNYTPYQPNQAALNNLYGTGDGCSAYGNRNFWRLFNDWFGSSAASYSKVVIGTPLIFNYPTKNIHINESVWFSFNIVNTNNIAMNTGSFNVCARRLSDNANYDISFQQNINIEANGVYTYWGKFTPPSEGAFKFWICNFRDVEGWSASYPVSANPNYIREHYINVSGNPSLTSSLAFNPSSPKVNEPVTATFTIRNNGTQATNIGTAMVAVRGPQGQDKSFAPDYNVTIQPGQTYTYSKTMTSQFDGMHNAYIVINRPGIGWTVSYPQALNNTIVRKIDAVFTDTTYLTSSLAFNPSSPKVNEPVTATFTIRNNGTQATNIGTAMVAVRGPQGQDKSFAPDYNVTIQPGQTYTYSKTMTSQFDGMHNAYIVINRPGIGWTVSYPQALNNTIVRKIDAVFTDTTYLTSSLAFNPSSPKVNEPVTATFTIRNNGTQATNIGTAMVAVRGPQGQDKSFAPDYNVTIQPGQTYTYSKTMTSQFDGMHNAYIVINRPGIGWTVSYPQALNNTIVRKIDAVFTR